MCKTTSLRRLVDAVPLIVLRVIAGTLAWMLFAACNKPPVEPAGTKPEPTKPRNLSDRHLLTDRATNHMGHHVGEDESTTNTYQDDTAAQAPDHTAPDAHDPGDSDPLVDQLRSSPPNRSANTTECELEAVLVLAEASTEVRGLAITRRERGYLTAWPQTPSLAVVQNIDIQGARLGSPSEVAVPAADYIRGLHSVGEQYLLMTNGLCPDRSRFEKCVQVVALDSEGHAIGPQLEDRVREWQNVIDEHASPAGVTVLRWYHYRPPELVRYVLNARGRVARETLLDLQRLNVNDYDVVGGAVSEHHAWLIAWGEKHELHSLHHPRAHIRGLTSVRAIHDSDANEEGLTLLYEDSEKEIRYAEMSWDGEMVVDRSSGDVLPERFRHRIRTVVSREEGRILVSRLDAVDRRLQPPVVIEEHGTFASIACNLAQSDCAVLWSTAGKRPEIRFSHLTCR